MRKRHLLHVAMQTLRASVALGLTFAPVHFTFDDLVPKLAASMALADDDNESGGGESDGGGGGSDDDDGHDSDDDDGGDDHDNSGSGHDDDDDDDDNSGPGSGSNDDDDDDDHHPQTGDRVEIDGNSIEVIHPDGTKEEIKNGVYEMKDARGRTIVERRATQADVDRLMAMAS